MSTMDALPALGSGTRVMLADEVYAVLQQAILDGTMAPDARINAGELARRFEVSPTPVREALARLEADGLVEKHALKGYRTTDLLDRGQVNDLFELRMLLEPGTAARAAERRSDEDAATLFAEIVLARRAIGHRDAYSLLSQHDVRLHDTIFRAAKNETTRAAFARTHCHLHTYRLAYTGSYVPGTVDEHERIVTAIANGEPDTAEAEMRTHIERSRVRLLESFET